jgi:hypothetical protein
MLASISTLLICRPGPEYYYRKKLLKVDKVIMDERDLAIDQKASLWGLRIFAGTFFILALLIYAINGPRESITIPTALPIFLVAIAGAIYDGVRFVSIIGSYRRVGDVRAE